MTETSSPRKLRTPRAIITISMSIHEVQAVDDAAQRCGLTRAGFIREEALRGARREEKKLAGAAA